MGHLAAKHGRLNDLQKTEIVALARTDTVWARRLVDF